MDTGSVQNILGVATQGRGDGQPQWVGSYKVSVSNDSSTWVAVDGGFTFTGNTVDGDTIVRNNFTAVVTARHGRGDGELQWVSSYTVSVSNDSSTWVPVDGDGPAGTIATHGLTFTGNTGIGDTVVRNNFAAPVTARYVGIEPYEWSGLISMRAGVYIGSVPTYGLETFSPPEATFSSIWDANAIKSPISIATSGGTAWIAHSDSMNLLQWLAMDTGSLQNIEGVATQGRGGDTEDQWVSSYTVSVSHDKISWVAVDGGSTFTGNTGRGDAVVRNNFAAVVTARYVRIEPVTWTGYIAMRAGVYVERGASLPYILDPCPPHLCRHPARISNRAAVSNSYAEWP
ncbi:galactose-binding domain-like protein [Baffinella frigidus]|nr:galactose-binding domain-like protein [Cryptophyta sp. CCMP2293]